MDFLGYVLFFISVIITLRFALRIGFNKEFNSYLDLIAALVFSFIFFMMLNDYFPIGKWVDNIFAIDTESKVIQLFIVHMYLLMVIFILVTGSITIIISMLAVIYFGIKSISYDSFLVGTIVAIISSINNVIKKLFNISFVKSFLKNKVEPKLIKFIDFINKYVNPFKGIRIKPIYKNISKIRTIFLLVYIIVGILILNYWTELITFLNFQTIHTNKVINIPKISDKSFENYRLIFFVPLLGILVNNVFKNSKK
ncbi:hypothetical protein [Inconstantimicrobium mannanitabidum]|uniref:Uncharacterized protein n=1 Tax=Inconstantimicrobium mannanitabidum TaxID=1604901 RepID=A0ACB5R9J3_9CLOT|nr:hypothetical protein [Clostridium sp. TW13]GKX65850.1 hypothetical protein rsdtw13_11080 [Clostridium sp. TW13]